MSHMWTLGVRSKQGKAIVLAMLPRDTVGLALRNKIAHAIADSTRMQVTIDGALSNPVSASALYDAGARWYITTQGGTQVAALFLRDKARSRQLVQAIADTLRVPLVVREVLRNPHRQVRRDLALALKVGSTWSKIGGGRGRIVRVDGNRVHVARTDTGDREAIDVGDFLASWRPPAKANPSRTKTARAARAYSRGTRASRLNRKMRRSSTKALRRPARPGNAAQSIHYLESHRARLAKRGKMKLHGPKYNPRPRVVYNKLLGGWYVVTGPHQTPLNGRFDTKAEAQAWLARKANPGERISKGTRVMVAEGPGRGEVGVVVDVDHGRYFVEFPDLPGAPQLYHRHELVRALTNPRRAVRGNTFPAIDHSILSPSGRVSKRARDAALKREAARLFPVAGMFGPEPKTDAELRRAKREALLRTADNLRGLAARSMSPRKYAKEAARLEAEAAAIPNPTFRVTGTIRTVSETRRRRAPRARSSKRAVPPTTSPALSVVPSPTPAPRRGRLQPGERVTVPYTGRGSYFGRKVKRTREHATVQGYVDSPAGELVHVMVKRGRSAESHQFPTRDVRRVPKRAGARGVAQRVRGLKHKLVAADLRDRLTHARAELEAVEREFAAADALAGSLYPQQGETPSREYSSTLAKLRRLRDTLDARREIVVGLERDAGVEPTPFPDLAVGDPFGNPKRRRAVRSRARGNPRDSVAAARRTFEMWHEYKSAGGGKLISVPERMPDVLVPCGVLKSFVYESDKFAGGPDNPSGRKQLYEHKTKRPHPVLATDPEGRDVFIVGGDMQVTGDGFVN